MKNFKLFFYSAVAISCALQSQKIAAQTVSLTTLGVPYTQNFDALAITGTTNTLTIPGWYLTEAGGGGRDNEQYASDNGASNTGDSYSYGTTGNTERALGSLRSGMLISTIGAAFTNNTGSTVTSVDVSYFGEEWRLGVAARTDAMNFEYSLNATDLTTGTWTGVSALNFITPNTVTTGAKDGNAAANRTSLSATISALSIPDGATFWIRWQDTDASSSDDGLAVDDLSLTPFTTVPTNPEMDVLGNAVSIANNDATPSTADSTDFGSQSFCAGTVIHTFTIANTGTADLTFSGTPHVTVSGANASDFTVSVQPSSPVAAAGTTTFTVIFDPSAAGIRIATLSIDNNDSDENPYSFSIQGTGLGLSVSLDSQTNVSCFGGSNGAATVSASGGTPSYTYSWAPSGGTAATASGLTADTYSCTVTDAGGCSQTQTVTITEPGELIASSSAASILCNGGTADITVSATGGTGAYTGTGNFTVSAGTYNYTVTDANGCSATTGITVTEPAALAASSSATSILCNGGTADITVSATGGTGAYTGAGNFTVSAGTYNYTVTDANGCSATTGITVTQPALLAASSSATSILCNGGTADITVSATGGTGTYTGTGNFTVSAGTYNYTVTDANGCSATTGITITEPAALVASSSATTILCNGETADITVNATGGTGTYTGTGNFTVSAGTYNYVVTDINGCSATTGITVTQPAAIAATQTISLCAGESLTVGTITHSGSGIYTDTLTAMNGCDSIVTSNLTISAAIDVSTSLSGNIITAALAGASAYQWIDCNNGNTPLAGETAQSYTAITDGSFAVVITEGSCSDTSSCVAIIGTGINYTAAGPELNVYPNPANDVVTVLVENTMLNKQATLFLYNSTGQLISETPISNTKTEIGLSSLPKGIYFITLQDQDGVTTKKITKQ